MNKSLLLSALFATVAISATSGAQARACSPGPIVTCTGGPNWPTPTPAPAPSPKAAPGKIAPTSL